MDTQEMCITEGIVVDGIVDSLMRTWLWSWKMEDQLQKGLFCLSALFAERSDAHAKKSPCLTTSMDETMYAAMARHPGKTGLAVQQAIMSCIQAGIRPLARIIYVEEEDFNTVYELELFPSRRMFQLRETITLRN